MFNKLKGNGLRPITKRPCSLLQEGKGKKKGKKGKKGDKKKSVNVMDLMPKRAGPQKGKKGKKK